MMLLDMDLFNSAASPFLLFFFCFEFKVLLLLPIPLMLFIKDTKKNCDNKYSNTYGNWVQLGISNHIGPPEPEPG